MRKGLQLRVPVPCNENWNQMSPNDQGRFCLSCQKTVVDFSSMTDEQIISYFTNTTTKTCGRFSSDQLNRNLNPGVQRNSGWFKYFIRILIPAVIIGSKTYAQGSLKSKAAVCDTVVKREVSEELILGGIGLESSKNFLTGRVVDTYGAPVMGATILIKETNTQYITDTDGKYIIENLKSLPATLLVSCVGFSGADIRVDKDVAKKSITIVLELMAMGDTVTVPVYRKKSLPFAQFKKLVPDSLKSSKISVYPNPITSNKLLTIEYKCKSSGDYSIAIFDMNGKQVQVEQAKLLSKLLQRQIRIADRIIPGTYTIQIIDPLGKNVASQKIIVTD